MIDTGQSEPERNTAPALSLFKSPPRVDDRFDEAFVAPSQPRQHWQELINALERRGASALKSAHERACHMRHEDGATINPFDDSAKRSTSWDLDIIPLPITAAEWRTIETGLIQRAHVLEKVLADVYGPQQLLREGQLPAELVFANPNFLHSCHNIQPQGNRFLTFYSADLYRATDGTYRIYRDLASNPAGLGYALENRIVISRIFSELYHTSQIFRLAPFFQTFQHAFLQRASLGKENPGIVLLSPGPESPIYFEHALLSRYLGYPLVESQDLTVRNGKVFLKKLAGLEPVEAIFRHITDDNSDPFALRREKAIGVAGLIQVCRENNIDMVNPIGSGFVDTPALSLFLPQICKHLLGEELQLRNHPAWWCGESVGRNHVMTNPSQFTFKHAMNREYVGTVNGDAAALLHTAPFDCIAEEEIQPAEVPVWQSDQVVNRPALLRFFVCATEQGFTVMPGGLAVTAADTNALTQGKPEDQQSKDIWVISEGPVEPFSLMDGFHAVNEFKRSTDLPSRVADHLLWLGRYLERSEGLVRLLRSVFRRISGEDRPQDIPELHFLLNLLRAKNIIPSPPKTAPDIPLFQELNSYLKNALFQKDKNDSVVSILRNVQRASRKVRDRLSIDSFRIINHLEELADSPSTDPLEFLDEVLFALSGFSGLAMESMTRSLGWRFMDMGRRVERAIYQTNLISMAMPLVCYKPRNTLEALLEVSDSTMTYRARYRSAFQLAPVLDLLLIDESNPKSLAFQLSQIAAHVEHLPRQSERRFTYPEERIALEMLTAVRLLELHEINCREEDNTNQELLQTLKKMSQDLKEFSQHITGHYLTRVQTTPHFTMNTGE